MKYLFFLLCLNICQAQDYKKVTAYRIVEESEDGPCSIVSYIRSREFGSVYTAESEDQEMIKKLLALKKQAKKWKKTGFWCTERLIGGMTVDNMFVFEGSKANDTLFTTNVDHLVVFLDKQVAYKDRDSAIYKALNKHFKGFFDRNFKEEYYGIWDMVLDSISVNKLYYKDKPIALVRFPDIKKYTKTVKLIDTLESNSDSIKDYYNTYQTDLDTIEFKNDDTIQYVIVNDPSTFLVGGIKVGDSEQVIADKYPASAKHAIPVSTRFEEMEYKYAYKIRLENGKGTVSITIDNKIVRHIDFSLNH